MRFRWALALAVSALAGLTPAQADAAVGIDTSITLIADGQAKIMQGTVRAAAA